MKQVLSDIRRGFKINTLLKRYRGPGIDVMVILYCIRMIQTNDGRTV